MHEVQHVQIVTMKPIIMPGMSSWRSGLIARCGQPCVREIVAVPRDAKSTPGTARIASTKATASAIGVGCMKIFGLVTKRYRLAITTGINVNAAPFSAAARACFSHVSSTA